jgi:hypothetical protein
VAARLVARFSIAAVFYQAAFVALSRWFDPLVRTRSRR